MYKRQPLPSLGERLAESGIQMQAFQLLKYAASSYSTALPVSYTHLRAHETVLDLVCRLLLEKKNITEDNAHYILHISHIK